MTPCGQSPDTQEKRFLAELPFPGVANAVLGDRRWPGGPHNDHQLQPGTILDMVFRQVPQILLTRGEPVLRYNGTFSATTRH